MFRRKIEPDIELCILDPKHAAELFALIDRNRDHLRRWLTWVDETQKVEDCRANRRNGLERYAANGSFDAGIWCHGELTGVIGIHQIDWDNRRTAIGYWLGEEFQGKGLVTSACRVLLEHSFSELALNRIEIRAATGNYRSRAIPERLGFTREGTLRKYQWLEEGYVDIEVYSLLRSEWMRLKEVSYRL